MNSQRLPFNVLIVAVFTAFIFTAADAQYVSGKGNDVTTPLHLIKPDYITPYGETTKENIKEVKRDKKEERFATKNLCLQSKRDVRN